MKISQIKQSDYRIINIGRVSIVITDKKKKGRMRPVQMHMSDYNIDLGKIKRDGRVL